jgi:deoxyribodipyrimidine photo-lyase
MNNHTLLWFQRDLRIEDNPALAWAVKRGNPIIAVYVHSPDEDAPWQPGAASRWWLHQSLQRLSKDLSRHGVELRLFEANSVEKIPQLADACSADAVVWTNRHEPDRIKHESTIERTLRERGISVRRFRDELLAGPDRFLTTSKQTPYKVFTPFYQRLRRELDLSQPGHNDIPPRWKSRSASCSFTDTLKLDQLNLLDKHPWHQKLHTHWSPGEQDALRRLEHFVEQTLEGYPVQRDIPAEAGTSMLSPHLAFGEISPWRILHALVPLIEFGDAAHADAAESFLRQLVWREFARYILWHFPETKTKAMDKRFTPAFWKKDAARLRDWQRGNSGIPIIDAGMRQLWECGWMHNRVRMLVASLLTKNLGIPWQAGARWFWDTLVDADLANNSMGWQWVAGCGVDAAPYFRIFNPETQARRFDPDRRYVQQWLDPDHVLRQRKPVIDLAVSRADALERYNRLVRGRRETS